MTLKPREIRMIRIANGIPQKDLAELLNIPYSTYSNYENDHGTMREDMRAKATNLLKELGCDFSILQSQRGDFPKYTKVYAPRPNRKSKQQEEEPVNTPDPRYNVPKEEPTVSEETVKEVLGKNEIYRRARSMMNQAQNRQIAYGIQKYPEPLNPDTWSTVETIDHFIEESIDQLHYLVMLKIKLEQMEANQ